ncbi:hypothetical protein I546_0686 [Mycobacterium kansasii 732]|nr:hypothetical protein I546_0686 [Mycobacterium kansasii 732]
MHPQSQQLIGLFTIGGNDVEQSQHAGGDGTGLVLLRRIVSMRGVDCSISDCLVRIRALVSAVDDYRCVDPSVVMPDLRRHGFSGEHRRVHCRRALDDAARGLPPVVGTPGLCARLRSNVCNGRSAKEIRDSWFVIELPP